MKVENTNRGKCKDCKWWTPDLQIDTFIIDKDNTIERSSLSSLNSTYGKCNAIYFPTENNELKSVKYDFGVFGSTDCIAKDGQGNYLFDKLSEG